MRLLPAHKRGNSNIVRKCWYHSGVSCSVFFLSVSISTVLTTGSENIIPLVTYSLLTGHTFFSHICQVPTNSWHILACQTTRWHNPEFLMKGIGQVWGNSILLFSSQQRLSWNYNSNPLWCNVKDSRLLLNSSHSSEKLIITAKICKATLTPDYSYFIERKLNFWRVSSGPYAETFKKILIAQFYFTIT